MASASQDAVRALQHYPSEDTVWHWRFIVLEAEALAKQSSYPASLELLKRDPPSFLGDDELTIRRGLVQSVASARLQRSKEALQLMTQAEALARAKRPDLLGEVLSAEGAVKFVLQDWVGSSAAYSEVLRIGRQKNDPFTQATALSGLGVVATKLEHFDESIDLDEASVALAQSVGEQNTQAYTLGNIAWCYMKLGDHENALAFYKQAEEVSTRNGQIGLQLYWLTGLSNVYLELQDARSAESVLTQALELARRQEDKATLIAYLNALAVVALQTGRINVAERYLAEASTIENFAAGQSALDHASLIWSALLRARIDEAKHNYAQAQKSLQTIIGNPETDTAQRWEAHDQLARVYMDEGSVPKAEREFAAGLQSIEAARSSVGREDLRVSFIAGTISFYDDYIGLLMKQGRSADALRLAELSRARTLAEGLSVGSGSRTAVSVRAQQLAQNLRATVLFYWLGQEQSYLWVITPGQTTYFNLPKAAEIEPVVKSYRKAVLGMRDAQDAGSADGQKLYGMLVEPAKKLIPKGSRVILLPAESLYGLNFETLVVPEPQPHFWIEDVTLTTANSLTLLASSVNHTTANWASVKGKSLLLVGNTEQPNADFPALAQAPAEMRSVEQYFPEPDRKVLEGKQATRAAYLSSNPERFTYLHFVTHGTASLTRPLESAVILSPEGDSYKLYAREIIQHPLRASLVTISACNGSGTRAYSGEGLVGLSWAFLRAGAHNVIGALWEVSDASTPQLMDALYAELSRGKDPATALRDAKLSLLHSSNPNSVFKKPFYWAPFQLYAGS